MHKKVLPSGLTVVCEEVPYVRSISLGVLIKIGSRYEIGKEQGITHFIEHMMFKGTETLSSFEIAEQFDLLGVHVDAFTGREYTCFYVKMIDDYLPKVLQLLSDIIINSIFPDDSISKEKEVVLEEIKMYLDSPDEFILDFFMNSLFNGHPLGKPIIGSENFVQNFSQKEILSYFRKFYRPNNTIISLAGNLECEEVFNIVERYFNNWERGELDFNITTPTCNFTKENKEKKIEQVHMCFGTQGIPYNHTDRYKLALLNDILGGSMSSHLFQEVREKRGLAYAISSFYENFFDTGVFTVYAATERNKVNDVIEVVMQEFKNIKTNKVSHKELHKVKEQLKGLFILSLENTANRMTRLLKQEFYLEKYLTVEEFIREIDKVTEEDITELANKILNEDKLKLVTYGPLNNAGI